MCFSDLKTADLSLYTWYAHREKRLWGDSRVKKYWAEESNLMYKNKEEMIMSISIGEKKIIIISVYNRGSWKNLEVRNNSRGHGRNSNRWRF